MYVFFYGTVLLDKAKTRFPDMLRFQVSLCWRILFNILTREACLLLYILLKTVFQKKKTFIFFHPQYMGLFLDITDTMVSRSIKSLMVSNAEVRPHFHVLNKHMLRRLSFLSMELAEMQSLSRNSIIHGPQIQSVYSQNQLWLRIAVLFICCVTQLEPKTLKVTSNLFWVFKD